MHPVLAVFSCQLVISSVPVLAHLHKFVFKFQSDCSVLGQEPSSLEAIPLCSFGLESLQNFRRYVVVECKWDVVRQLCHARQPCVVYVLCWSSGPSPVSVACQMVFSH
ncbi:hypothetical protein F4604DRAFT_1709361 [Suillus subluteus]|nr:hypothetical protein F4604DRAFT_1709361 [Suillus subluteus]